MTARIDFAGDATGPFPLTWGQQAIWAAIGRTAPNDHYFNLDRVLIVPPKVTPLTVEAALAAVGTVMSRHASLRTRIRAGRQHVDATGTLDAVIETATGDVEATATALADRLTGTRFRYDEEYPLRVGLVVAGDGVRAIVLGFCHLATDGHGAEIVVRDLRLALLGRTGPVPGRVADLVAEQQSAEGRRRSDTAVGFWADAYRRMPVSMFPTPRAEPEPARYRVARLRSPALALACRLLAARHRVSTTAVLMAATAAVVAADSGEPAVAMLLIAGNRIAPEHRDLVATLSQEGLFLLDTAGAAALDDLFVPAWRAGLRAYRIGMYDQVSLDEALARVCDERGELVHPYCCFNDMRLVEQAGVGKVPTAEQVDTARAGSTLTWAPPQERVSCRFCLHVETDDDALVVSLTADSRYLPPPRIQGMLGTMERLVVESAAREAVLPSGGVPA